MAAISRAYGLANAISAAVCAFSLATAATVRDATGGLARGGLSLVRDDRIAAPCEA